MFHVKQNSLDSDNLQGLSCILHMLQLSYPISLPLPREGIKGRGRGWVVVVSYPTLPSRLTLRSFCASTANSIGSFCNTSLA